MFDIYVSEFKNSKLDHNRNLLIEGKYLPSRFLIEVLKELRKKLHSEVINSNDIKNSISLILK